MNFTSMDSSQSSLPEHLTPKSQLHRTTVARRAKGEIQPRDEYLEYRGLLSKTQEIRLIKYIKDLTKRGLPPTPRNIRCFAHDISGKWPGKNWPSNLVRRYRDILDSGWLSGFDLSRKKADTTG
jgi:hypothetical protein